MIPYDTLAVEMTADFNQRTFLTGSKAMFGKVANFLGAAIPGLFISIFGKTSPLPFFCTGVVYCLIMIASLLLLYFNSWERPYEEVADEEVPNVIEGVKKLFIDIISTLKIKSFREHLGMYLFGFGAEWLFTATFTYFIVFCLQRPSTFVSEMNSMSSILQLVSTALFIGIVAKKGFTKPFIGALVVVIGAILGYAAIFVFHVHDITAVVIAITIVFGLGTGGVYYIPWTAYTFMADVDEVVTNRRREGVYAGAMTMAGKLMRASVVFILGQVLAHYGFVSGASAQPTSAINAIIGVLLIGVAGMACIGIIFSFRLKLDHKTHKVVIEELARVHNGGKMSDVTPETKQVVEMLTGISYENCFGNNNIGYKCTDSDANVKVVS
jgi:oligogalacturonide transporter